MEDSAGLLSYGEEALASPFVVSFRLGCPNRIHLEALCVTLGCSAREVSQA